MTLGFCLSSTVYIGAMQLLQQNNLTTEHNHRVNQDYYNLFDTFSL